MTKTCDSHNKVWYVPNKICDSHNTIYDSHDKHSILVTSYVILLTKEYDSEDEYIDKSDPGLNKLKLLNDQSIDDEMIKKIKTFNDQLKEW